MTTAWLTGRTAAMLIAASLLATGCGGSAPAADGGDGGRGSEVAAPARSSEAATAPDEPTVLFEDAEPVDGRATVMRNADGSRTVVTGWGEVVVTATPQRVVSVIGDIDLETMLALGDAPIAAGTQGGTLEEGFAPHLDDLIDGIEPLAWADGPPAETIATLEPDLIFAYDQESAELLGEIAPAVPRGAWNGEWKQDVRYIGAVLGRSDDVEQLLADFEARAATLRDRVAEEWGQDATVGSAQIYSDHSQVGLDGPVAFSTQVLADLGLEMIPLTESGDEWGLDLSLERLPEIDADHLFWQVRQDEDGEPDMTGIEVLSDTALWDRIPAVDAGQVHFVDNRPWYFPTILGAHVILDDVEAALDGDSA